MRVAITNLIRNGKLKFIDVRNKILAEEVQRKDFTKALTSNSALNVDNRGRSSERNSNEGNGNRDKSKNGRGESRNDRNLECWVLDSGASFHTTSQRDILENYVAGNHGKDYLADGEPLKSLGWGMSI